MTEHDLHFASTVDIAAAIRSGRVSSAEVVEACLRRIGVVNPRINAVVCLADGSLEAARAADADLRHGVIRGPLHGVPFTIKDSLDTAGVVTTAGTVGWAERVPERDATVVARLKAAGGILLGKTNTPEFTWSNEADNLVYGRTSNPYDLDRSSGGSSGGSAAIVAAGGSPFDIGSDTGDSIRQPAHVCGVAGLKPTSGRVPRTGHSPSYRGILESLTQLGPIARRVDDLATAPGDHRRPGRGGPARRPGGARRSGRRRDPRPARGLVRRQRDRNPDPRDDVGGHCGGRCPA